MNAERYQELKEALRKGANLAPVDLEGMETFRAEQEAIPIREKELRRILLPRIVDTTVRERVIAQILALFPIEEAKARERKEVVDWVDKKNFPVDLEIAVEWHNQKKEWGL